MNAVLEIAYLLLMPALAFGLAHWSRWAAKLGPVVFAYLFGLLLAHMPFHQVDLAATIRDLAIPLAIPLLLFGLDVGGWVKGARATVVSFGLCLMALVIVCVSAHLVFSSQLSSSAEVAGMLAGLYSGGSPNMAVVHSAIGSSAELYAQINAIDFVSGAAYFLFLITLAGPVFGLVLKTTDSAPADPRANVPLQTLDVRGSLLVLAMSALIVSVTAGLVQWTTATLAVAPIMLGITTLAIVGSFWPRLRRVRSSYGLGYYLVTVFCCALGSQLQIDQLEAGLGVLAAMHMSILLGTILLHIALARLAGIDRDTAIITQTAALYGPPFVPPVAGALNNPAMLLSGLTTGLVGYAVGNYLGIGLAMSLR